jgi:uncharacterized protein
MTDGLTRIHADPASYDPAGAREKEKQLIARLGQWESLIVAFSGGADSAYLAWAAHRALDVKALAITALSASFSAYDREQAEAFVRRAGVRHEFIRTRELENPLYLANDPDRCYYCKAELFTELDRIAAERGFAAVAYGIHADDTTDFRPGHRAADEHQVLAPLLEARLSKAEIRALSRDAGLPTWDRPASACLSSRVPYGTPVTPATLAKIEAGEGALRSLGFRQFRVRYYGEHARLEFDQAELARAFDPAMLRFIEEGLRAAGFISVTVDPQGYRQGSLNEELKKRSAAEGS